MSRNAYHLYGNFGEHFQASGTGVTFFRTENSDGIEIYMGNIWETAHLTLP